MEQEKEFTVRLNSHGEPDVDYYIAQAHKMRGEAIASGFRVFRNWLTKALDRAWFPDTAHSEPRRRVVQSDWPWVDLILQGTPNRKAGHV
jgi:hypothetical protein